MGIWVEQEKSTVTDVIEMHESHSSGSRHAQLTSHGQSLGRLDEDDYAHSDTHSEHSCGKVDYEAI